VACLHSRSGTPTLFYFRKNLIVDIFLWHSHLLLIVIKYKLMENMSTIICECKYITFKYSTLYFYFLTTENIFLLQIFDFTIKKYSSNTKFHGTLKCCSRLVGNPCSGYIYAVCTSLAHIMHMCTHHICICVYVRVKTYSSEFSTSC
jgi:hypothetical protein